MLRQGWHPKDSVFSCMVCVPAFRTCDPPLSFIDLYGRGYSDAPQTTYDTSLYTTQLALLLQYVGWTKTNVAGVSMVRTCSHLTAACQLTFHQGGSIAAAFSVQFPHLVTGDIALIATAGVVQVRKVAFTVLSVLIEREVFGYVPYNALPIFTTDASRRCDLSFPRKETVDSLHTTY